MNPIERALADWRTCRRNAFNFGSESTRSNLEAAQQRLQWAVRAECVVHESSLPPLSIKERVARRKARREP